MKPKNNYILYVQYTNPAGYPPLEHSSRIFADLGWQVRFLGIEALGSQDLVFPEHEKIKVKILKGKPAGWRQKLHYLWFTIWVVRQVLLQRPKVVYLSDLFACPAGLLIAFLSQAKIIYHEHDSPDTEAKQGIFIRWLLWTRQQLATKALLIFPNADRGKIFVASLPQKDINFITVWNCPRLEEANLQQNKQTKYKNDKSIWLYYHGNISPQLVPLSLFKALEHLPDIVKLRIIGYETIGTRGYIDEIKALSIQKGIDSRLEIINAMPRNQLLQWARKSDIGLALMPKNSKNKNLSTMAGASNKAFDYLSCGLPLIVSNLPDWEKMYVKPGYGLACDPENVDSIVFSIQWFIDHPVEMRAMGEAGKAKIVQEWHYEKQFETVLNIIQSKTK